MSCGDDTDVSDEGRREPALEPGTCLGRFTIRARLGAGGMGEVFSARDPELDRVVALKVLRSEVGGGSPQAQARFRREAQAMARLNHPNVVSVFDVGAVGDRLFVAMELVEGPTLLEWLAAGPRGWREILEVFIAAGRGLEAAHAAGIVHRDFKPSNVLVGDRVRVADFGLARAVADLTTDAAPTPPALSMLEAQVTSTRRAIGTPAYMAPEQRAGKLAGPLADQYSFGVALHEALYGFRPGQPAGAPPAPRAVPARLRPIIERTLSERPEGRYPSMRLLLADLGRGAARARRGWLVTAGAVVVAAAGGFLLHARSTAAAVCPDADALVASVWNDAARGRLQAAFARSHRAHAADTAARVEAALGARTGEWALARRDACEATHLRHEHSEEKLDRRVSCLDRARSRLGAVIALLGEADDSTVDRAVQAVNDAVDVEACADPPAAAAPVPRNQAAAHEIDDAHAEIARLLAMRSLGQWKAGRMAAEALLDRARRIDDTQLLAETEAVTGWFQMAGGDVDTAVQTLYDATARGAAAHDDAVVAAAFTDLVYALGERKQRFDAADVAFASARAALARSGNPPRRLANLYTFRAHTLARKGDALAVLPLRILVWDLRRRIYGAEGLAAADALGYVAEAMTDVGFPSRTPPIYDRAIAMTEKAAGPRHPALATLLNNAGVDRLVIGDVEGAAPLVARALAIAEENFGPDSAPAARYCATLAEARLRQRRLPEAHGLIDRALRIHGARDAEGPDWALDESVLAEILRLEGRLAEAHGARQRALAAFEKSYGATHPWVVEVLAGDAGTLLDLGRLPEGRVAAERALAGARASAGASPAGLASALVAEARVRCAERRCADAVPMYREALALLERLAGGESSLLVEPLIGLCHALVETGADAAAADARERALRLAAGGPGDLEASARACAARVARRAR